MRRIHYASGSVLTGDRTCKALLRYARALGEAHIADVVEIPVVTDAGSRAYAHLLIGPASQIFSTPVPDSPDEPLDVEVIERLERATYKLHPTRPAWPEEMTDIPNLDWDFDFADEP
ncbi:hypothetical protein DEJ21_15780 [Curtobacterium sp. MCSS17_006]|uniref:hypothetical protein n=1 Tax=unclassified Curtobacterium TaxID=257496 RepID=UPI000DA81719|nr:MULTISPECIES: hypothetical protein [unclassified Curtobacterium]PZE32890.1 hypothetical protein DEJ21_15780 [Curtobacterium sp. MCSS17_006]WIB33263.1 hypothetical protein DEJ20_02035 [Curtobacterium sp. MCSS17_005]